MKALVLVLGLLLIFSLAMFAHVSYKHFQQKQHGYLRIRNGTTSSIQIQRILLNGENLIAYTNLEDSVPRDNNIYDLKSVKAPPSGRSFDANMWFLTKQLEANSNTISITFKTAPEGEIKSAECNLELKPTSGDTTFYPNGGISIEDAGCSPFAPDIYF